MKVRAICLYAAGTRRHSDELRSTAGEIGELEMDACETQKSDRRLQLQARLTVPFGKGRKDALPPIYDVVLLKVTRRGMLLRGIENVPRGIVESRTIAGYVQEWWCEPVTDQQGTQQ